MTQLFKSATEVAEEIETRLKRITVANGYLTDIGAAVHMGRIAIDDTMVPCSSVIEGDDQVTNSSGRSSLAKIGQEYALVGYAECHPDRPNDTAHKVIRDLKRAIFMTDGRQNSDFGGRVDRIDYRGRNIGPRADGAGKVMALIEITVFYTEQLGGI